MPLLRASLLFPMLLAAAAAQESGTDAGIDAAVHGEWGKACACFAGDSTDVRSSGRLAAARAQVVARLAPAIEELTRRKRWSTLAEVVACGLAADPGNYRYTGAAKRLEREGITALPTADDRILRWASRGLPAVDAEELIEGCLAFLVKTQEQEGHWDCKKHGGGTFYDPGVTGLALLALGTRRVEAAERAAKALLGKQDKDGCIASLQSQHWIYVHAIATEALAVHAHVTGQQEKYRSALQRAVDYILEAQNAGSGWRYEPRGGENDTSATARCVRALAAAEAAGAEVPAAAYAGARAWVESMTDAEFGQVGYNLKGGTCARSEGLQERFPPELTQAMTASGMVTQLLTRGDPLRLSSSFSLVAETLPVDRGCDMYYWESASTAWALWQGQAPPDWYAALVRSAALCRDEDGGMKACDAWSRDGGRVYATAATAIALEAHHDSFRARFPGAAEFRRTGGRTVLVAGSSEGAPTGIYAEPGMVLTVESKGAIWTERDGPAVGAEGTRAKLAGGERARDRSAPFACLLARIDDGKPFVVPIAKRLTLRAYGHVWLLANDSAPGNNAGSWEVKLKLSR